MSKYGNLTYSEVCKLELEEMESILDKYNVSKEDKENLKDMVIESYFQASETARSGRVLENILKENNVEYTLKEYIAKSAEENKKYPFDVE